MLPSGRLGLVLSLGLSMLAQQPVLPQETIASLPKSQVNIAGQCTAQQVKQEVATIFDSQDQIWKRWSLTTKKGASSLELEMSVDGKSWIAQPAESFRAANSSDGWDGQITSPVIIYNQQAIDGRRFILWYVGSSKGAQSHEGLSEGALGMATSEDGRHFERLNLTESPYKVPGLILNQQDAFPGVAKVVKVAFGAAHSVHGANGWQISFSKIGLDDSGAIAAKGLERASSTDGTRWQVMSDDPKAVEIVGQSEPTGPLM